LLRSKTPCLPTRSQESEPRKDWPRFEFDTALREERNRSTESILPIRVDQARLVGLHDGRFYLSLRENSLAEIAACIVEKCKEADGDRMSQPREKPSSATKHNVAILSSDAKHVLGIIVVSQLPLPLGLYKNLFPEIDWSAHSRALAKYGLLRLSEGQIRPSSEATRAIRSDEVERKFCSELWVKRLEELKGHPDIALYLGPHYLSEGRWDDAIVLLSDIANQAIHGDWNGTYLSCLEKFAVDRLTRRLKPDTRIRLYHALAICSTQGDQYDKALAWFERVRKEGVKEKDDHWLGRYFINSAIALALSGNTRKAAVAYHKAIQHGKDHEDPTLVGRSLGNLAQLRMKEGEPDAAIDLIRQSIEWTKKARDEFGTAIASAQLGSIEANRGNLRDALKHLAQSETLCGEHGLIYEQAKSAYNIGNVYCDLGQFGNALKAYKRARRLADDDDYIALRLQAIQGIARAFHSLKRFSEIEKEFKVLLDSPVASKHNNCKLSAFHGIGLAQIFQGRAEEGRTNLKNALQLARKLSDPEWTLKVLLALAGTVENGDLKGPTPEQLARLGAQEGKRSNWKVAARLWELSAEHFLQAERVDEAERSFSSAATCLEMDSRSQQSLINLYFKLYAWRWLTGRFEKALEALQRAEQLAITHEIVTDRVKALDERGLSLQRLNRSKEALALHQRAVRLARKHELPTQLRTSLNNLGQAFRRLGRTRQAITAFDESERNSRAVGEIDEALGTMVNRGLTIQEGGDNKGAGAVLTKCRAEAKRRKFWREYVMAVEALGNLAWHRGRLKDAESHYRDALAVAKRQGINDSQPEIAVNYASLLRKLGRQKQALKLLKAFESQFGKMMDAHVCHEVIADLYLENGNVEAAKKHWELGKVFAQAVGNTDYVAICSASLAEVYESEKQFDAAERELETAIANEPDPELRARLLIDLLRVELSAGNDAKAEAVFNEARQIADENGLTDVIVDIHIHVADHEWQGDQGSKINAIKAYLVAVVQALSKQNLAPIPKVFRHIVLQLTNPHHAPSEPEFDLLLEIVRSELPAPTNRNRKALEFVLWPIETARRLLPLVGDQERFSSELEKATRNGVFG
jgi:tetratricopeptide (TPR) repeat protein